jgi:hypothetical protein
LALPVGWTDAPNLFTTFTETVADVANAALSSGTTFGPHPLESTSEIRPAPSAPVPPEVSLPVTAATPAPMERLPPSLPLRFRSKGRSHYGRPLGLWDVYVGEFLGLVRTRRRVKRALLHTLDTVLHPLDSKDSEYHKEPASTKKMDKWGCLLDDHENHPWLDSQHNEQ